MKFHRLQNLVPCALISGNFPATDYCNILSKQTADKEKHIKCFKNHMAQSDLQDLGHRASVC